MGALGIDDVQLAEQYAARLDTDAQTLSTIVRTIDGLTAKLGGVWHGPDCERFEATWRSTHRRTLSTAHQNLAQLATTVRKNIAAQVRTSDTLDGNSPVPGAIPIPPVAGGPGGPGEGGGPGDPGGDDPGGEGPESPNIDHVSEDLTTGIHNAITGKDDDKGVPIKLKAHQTLVNQQLGVDAHAHTNLGGVNADADANAALSANVTAHEQAKLGPDGAEASASIAGFAGASAAASAGLSNKYGSLKAQASATAGVQGQADAKIGLTKDGLDAEVGAGGFAGAQVQGSVSGDLGGVGATLGAHAYAGIGAHAGAEAEINSHEISVGVHVGVALGVGAELDPSIDIDPSQVIDTVNGIGSFGNDVISHVPNFW